MEKKYARSYLKCAESDVSQLGGANYKWKALYATNGAIQTSDRNVKRNIQDMDDRYIQLFDLVRPVTYMLINGDRVHTGFISQEVEEAMAQVGLTAEELGFFCKDIKTRAVIDENGKRHEEEVLDDDGNPVYIYSLRYEEYIAIMAEKYKRDLVNLTLSNNILVNKSLERIKKIYEQSDAFVILPGGIGTVEELFSILEENRNDAAEQITAATLQANWNAICEVVCQLPDLKQLEDLYKELAVKSTLDEIGVSRDFEDVLLKYSPMVRNRLTLMRIRKCFELS